MTKVPLFTTALLTAFIAANTPAETVKKITDAIETRAWSADPDSRAQSTFELVDDVAADLSGESKKAMRVTARFDGTGFAFLNALPGEPIVIPGETKRVSLWLRADAGNGAWAIGFRDGWGRDTAGGKKLEWNLTRRATGEWQRTSFDVPADWVQPIRIARLTTHNWASQTKPSTATLLIDRIEVETDLSGVDPATGTLRSWTPDPAPAVKPGEQPPEQKPPVTPLLTAQLAGAAAHNVFAGEKPALRLAVRSWKAQPQQGKLEWKISDETGAVVQSSAADVRVEDTFEMPVEMDVKRFGLYTVDAKLTWADTAEPPTRVQQPLAHLPTPHALSEADKDASPYGLNVLAARKPMVGTFKKAGIVWYRDYGFDYDWMLRAKGADKSYSAWPFYPKFVRMYEAEKVRVLACLKGAIRRPRGDSKNIAPHTAPDAAWVREIAQMMMAFPSIRAYELDNEYDLDFRAKNLPETAEQWVKYDTYHQKFGEIVRLLGGGEFIAVENGRAGIYPERVRRGVEKGFFAGIDVVNSHHYCGTDAPEWNVANHNTNADSYEKAMSFYDALRAAKRNGRLDGKQRQHWLTEFGWDTAAGPVVSPREQAAYLARGYMTAMAAGVEKSFWFFDIDAPVESQKQFFDGCGLVRNDQFPKLSLCAFAGLTHVLPRPQYVGTLSAGENGYGYLFRNDGKLVAAVYALRGEDGPTVTLSGERVLDMLGNAVDGASVKLTAAPTYVVGVDENSVWAKQAAYELESQRVVQATGGDEVVAELRVRNDRMTPIESSIRIALPEGWTTANETTNVRVAPGESKTVPLTFRVAPDAAIGEKTAWLRITEADDSEPMHAIAVRVETREPLRMSVRGLGTEPGDADVVVKITNRSAKPLDGTLRLKLPAAWRASTGEQAVKAIRPGETRDVRCKINWTADIAEGETAVAEFRSDDDRAIAQPIVPGRIVIRRAASFDLDGDLSDWPVKYRLPTWMLTSSTTAAANAEMSFAWADEGLYVAARVNDSKAHVPDPKTFWAGDGLELFVDTRADKSARKYAGTDHQFWLLPMVKDGTVYAGRWKRHDEIAQTQYDLAGVRGKAVKTDAGYVIECLLPASAMDGYRAAVGTEIGLNLNLTVRSKSDREVFWALPKIEGVTEQPATWGRVRLAD